MKDKSVTIVMTYWNRKRQLENTLKSIKQYGHDVKIIIVDDASTDGNDISCFEEENVKIITMKNKTWINPCIPFNTGLALADTDIVILQNAECIHNGDIVGHVINNIEKGTYLNYSAFSIDSALTERVYAGEEINSIINPYLTRYINAWIGWYNHPIYRPEMLHFCSAITREDLYELGGFDERYYNGLGYDDNEFILRIQNKGMTVKIIENPLVVHQFHKPFHPGDVQTLMKINLLKFEEAKKSREFDVKKYNTIFK